MRRPILRQTLLRRATPLVVLLAAAAVLPACGEANDAEDQLKAAIRRTDRLAYRFVYKDERPDLGSVFGGNLPAADAAASPLANNTAVQGVIEDDFKFKAQVSLGGKPTFERVVDDDSLAIRFLDVERLPAFVDREVLDMVKTDTDVAGVSVVDALKSQRWVLDTVGAPSVLGASQADRVKGLDPVSDALTVFDYVETAMDEAQDIVKFSKDALDPAYRATEDVFPKPAEGSGVTRFDLRRPKLPAVGAVGTSGRADTPATKHFRKMAIYVKGGRVIQVIERIELTGKAVEDFVSYLKAFLRENGLTKAQADAEMKQLDQVPAQLRGSILLAGLSANLKGVGGESIDQRVMSLDLQDLGEPNTVDLPTADVVRGSLAILVGAGRKPAEVTGETGATTTTTTPGGGTEVAPGSGPSLGVEPGDSTPTSSP